MAYSQPTDVKQTRDQAAITTMLWREQSAKLADEDMTSSDSSIDPSSLLKALTVEFETYNIIVRRIQSGLLLVLVGPASSKPRSSFKMNAEKMEDPIYPNLTQLHGVESEDLVKATDGETKQGDNFTILHLQRMKADKLVEYIEAELGDYLMPDDSQRLANFP